MPKTIDYPRTSYTSAWEVAEVVDDTGGKCALETAARKLNRKVSGSFKAIVGSAVKFGLLISKRELLTTTNLFRRIKHAYDKHEEKIYHREAFLHPPLFMQICRKFRNRELPVHMFDVMLIREFGVEEINAQSVAKAFVDGARMVDVIDERNIIADIDQLTAQQGPRRELASGEMPLHSFRPLPTDQLSVSGTSGTDDAPASRASSAGSSTGPASSQEPINSLPNTPPYIPSPTILQAEQETDPVSALFNLPRLSSAKPLDEESKATLLTRNIPSPVQPPVSPPEATSYPNVSATPPSAGADLATPAPIFRLQLSGPGLHTDLTIQDPSDLLLVQSLLEKIKRQLG